MKFRKRPIVIEAFQWNGDMLNSAAPKWLWEAIESGHACIRLDRIEMEIRTLEGVMTAGPGDWIIRGVKGELYPCKPDIFKATYESVTEERP